MRHLRQYRGAQDNNINPTNLLQWQNQLVKSSSFWQCDLGCGHLIQQRQDGDFIRSHPVFDAKHISMDHSVRHHWVEIQTFMHTRHLQMVYLGYSKERQQF